MISPFAKADGKDSDRAEGDKRERGAALIVSLITLVALLGIGTLTLLSVRSEVSSSGQGRFQQSALYAAESGLAVGMEFLRGNCDATNLKFSALVSPNNSAPLVPPGILGNGVKHGQPGNLFSATSQNWYQVTILNNPDDPGFVGGTDEDFIVILRSVGFAPNQTQATIEVEVLGADCKYTFCDTGYAQEGQNEANNANAVCAKQVDSGGIGLRTLTPG